MKSLIYKNSMKAFGSSALVHLFRVTTMTIMAEVL